MDGQPVWFDDVTKGAMATITLTDVSSELTDRITDFHEH